ncbi:MAG TPA: anthranilate phosphoribosyltransferase [Terriglobales bacterium]|nr:anthranilate phosphoribosyltransferase [Terriglobales bacterium]
MSTPLQAALGRLLRQERLTRSEARCLLESVFHDAGEEDLEREIGLAGILAALAARGESVEELVGFAEAMRAAVVDIGWHGAAMTVDICSTGGSPRRVMNISTAAAFAAAGAGATVAKHGNRSNTNACGAADVLEAAGLNLQFPASELGACLRENGIAFLFAPLLHPAMRRVARVRRALAARTAFNLLGPLTNPARAQAQIIGVPKPELVAKMAEALLALGTGHSFVIYAEDGIGEFSTTALNELAEINRGTISYYPVDARDLGLRRASLEELHCATKAEAVAALHDVLAGKPGPVNDIVSLNAAAVLVAAGKALDLRHGIALARAALSSGTAAQKLRNLVAHTHAGAGRTHSTV